MKKIVITSSILLAASMVTPLDVVAQETASLEEVVVTARRRSESLQDVPISITPFSAVQMERRDIRNLEDIAQETVGMNYWSSPTSGFQSSPTIRGLATGFLQDRIQNVAAFINGIYLQRQSMMNVCMTDLERVEILKGPQNAMYGRSAFAGAINYVTVKPTEEFGGYLSTTLAEDDRQDFRGAISGPLGTEKLLGRASFGISDYDGASKNYHPGAGINSSGFHNEDNLGGWEDETYNLALTWRPTERIEIGLEYYETELKRESQPYYIISGLLDVAAIQVGRFDDLNFNELTYKETGSGLEVTGHTMWKGELPDESPGAGTCIFNNPHKPCSEPDLRSTNVMVDPRAYGMQAETEVTSFDFAWELTDKLQMSYKFGRVEHEGDTAGPAERDQANGSEMFDITKTVNTSISSARPITELETDSHELRFDWTVSEKMSLELGLFYADVEDEQYDFTVFAPVCSDRDLNGDGSNADEIAGCQVAYEESVDNTPLDRVGINPFWLFAGENWHGNRGNHTRFDDEITAIFASMDWDFAEDWSLRLEARYSEEERSIERLTDGFSLPPGTVGCSPGVIPFCMPSRIVQPKDSDTFEYFTPRASLEWRWAQDSMAYASISGGAKAGGFNNASSTAQQTYDEEWNWSYELGSKNTFYDGRLRLNAALYYIDWEDIQGSEPPEDTSINSAAVIGNIGDATSKGLEIEVSWLITDRWSVDLGYSYNKAEYDNGDYDTAQRYLFYRCDREVVSTGEVCGETDISGNSLPRNSENQLVAGINYGAPTFADWRVDGRLSANYQDKQYISPLNEAYVDDRTLVNGDIQLTSPSGHWDLAVWVKNLTDEEYVGGVLNILEQNKYMVALGAERTWGVRLRYNF